MQRQDVGVRQAGCNLDLAQEALGAECGGELGPKHLQGDRTTVLEVLGEIDRGHAPAAQLALDRVAVLQRLGEAVRRGGHGEPPEGWTLHYGPPGRRASEP